MTTPVFSLAINSKASLSRMMCQCALLLVSIIYAQSVVSGSEGLQPIQLEIAEKVAAIEQSLIEFQKNVHDADFNSEDAEQQQATLLYLWRESFRLHKALAIDSDLYEVDPAFSELAKRTSYLYNELSELRAGLIKTQGATTLYQQDNIEYLDDLLREIESVPIRWFGLAHELLAIFSFSEKSEDMTLLFLAELILEELSKVLLFLLLGFILYRITQKTADRIKLYTEHLAKTGVHNKQARFQSTWLRILFPHFKWVVFLLYVHLGAFLLESGRFYVLGFLAPYVIYYVWFRIVRILIAQVLASGVRFPEIFSMDHATNKLSWTAQWLSLYAFWIVILIHTLKTVTGEGLFLYWFNRVSSIVSFILLNVIAYQWRSEIKKLADYHLRGWLQNLAVAFVSGWWAIIFSLPLAIFFLFFISFSRVYRWSERFEVVRRLSANLFRRQIESSSQPASSIANVPKEYRRVFLEISISKKNHLSCGQKEVYQAFREAISCWINNDCNEKLSVITGEQGSGKSQVALFILKEFEENYHTEVIKIQKRDINTPQIEAIEMLIDENSNNDVKNKSIVVIEQAENLFVSTLGGFDVFIKLIEKIQHKNKHCFLIFVFNSYAWDYLSLKFKTLNYFSLVRKMPEWTEAEIKALIMSQHESTGYTLNFDEIIEAAKGESDYDSMTYIEDKYFRLLREESKGNPAVAKNLWLGCLSYMGNNQLKVSIPKDRIDTMSMPENFYFVLTCIVRHTCINEPDIVASTDLSATIVRNVLNSCLERGYIVQVSGCYKLNLGWQHSILSTLRRKNFIYG